MEPVWFQPELSEELIKNDDLFEQTLSITTDIVTGRIDITRIVENLRGVLISKEVAHREKGIKFFTKILKNLPKNYLSDNQVRFISKFYTDRLQDNHRVVPSVLDGYLAIIQMHNYNIIDAGEFLTILFREVPCQQQVQQDRYKIYLLIKLLVEKNTEFMKKLGADFVYGVISSMDSERDPRNLMFLFGFLPTFLKLIPLGHLADEMFEVISCYYPIDFHPSPDDPAAVTRQNLADALAPCLCGTPVFAENCLVLLIEKLDSNLRSAKIDSLRLLIESCKTFNADSYAPFLKSLWSSIQREILNKTDDELRMVAHEALSALVTKLGTTANTDQAFETFIKGILITIQKFIAESTTVTQFVQVTKILLTTANATRESCLIITKAMIPAIIAFYEFKPSSKLQIASLDFLGDLHDLAAHWDILKEVEPQTKELPQLCLVAVNKMSKEYQIAGFKTLIRVQNSLDTELVVPFVEVLIHNVQHCQDDVLLKISVETVHTIARKYPELIMSLVVKGKCDLDNLTKDKEALQKRLNLLSHLASIDDFTKVIIEEMLKLISRSDSEAFKVVEALSDSMSNTSLYSHQKLTQIESDHGVIDSVLNWLLNEIETDSDITHGFNLISNTMSSLPIEKQINTLTKHTTSILEKCGQNDRYFLILHSLYNSLHKDLFYPAIEDIMKLSLRLALHSWCNTVRDRACLLIAHFLNKAEHGQKFELLYEMLKNYLTSCKNEEANILPKLIILYGWITKALILRGSDVFLFWLQKIVNTLTNPTYCNLGAEAISLIMADNPEHLTPKQHCRISLLHKQRMFVTYARLTENLQPKGDTKEAYLLSWAYVLVKAPKSVLKDEGHRVSFSLISLLHKQRICVTYARLTENLQPKGDTKEAYLLSWAYVLVKAPKSVLKDEGHRVCSMVIDSLEYDNKDLLLVMIDILCYFVQAKYLSISDSIQTILPRLVRLTVYEKSMDVRIKSLQCLYDIANCFRTSLLLPFKQDILIDLAPSLDDKKRLVRNMAVKARTRWFLIGSPGEPTDNLTNRGQGIRMNT